MHSSVLFALTFFVIYSWKSCSSETTSRASRSCAMGDVYLYKQSNATSFQNLLARSRKMCAMKCHKNPDCMSFDYCQTGVCLLYDEDVHTDPFLSLRDNPFCVHVGMRRDDHPKCVFSGAVVDIKDNAMKGAQVCSISRKRRDCFWGEWSGELIYLNYDDPNREYKRYTERKREPMASHGGIDCTGESEQVIERLRFLSRQLYFQTYIDSEATCKSIGGKLFGDINGTLEQVRLLCEMHGPNLVWIAVLDKETEGVWLNDEGIDVSNEIPWIIDTARPRPDGGTRENNLSLTCVKWNFDKMYTKNLYEDVTAGPRRGSVTCDLK